MKQEEYTIMNQVEDAHWWYVGHHRTFNALLERYCPREARGRVLDAGCGTGGYMQRMREHFAPHELVGVDISEEALRFCSDRGLEHTHCCSIESLPYPDGYFDLVVSFNVICHYAVGDDLETVRELMRVLKPGGWLLLNLPAFDILHGSHDAAVGGVRRYRAPGTAEMLERAGLEPVRLTYLNTTLSRGGGLPSLEPPPCLRGGSQIRPLGSHLSQPRPLRADAPGGVGGRPFRPPLRQLPHRPRPVKGSCTCRRSGTLRTRRRSTFLGTDKETST